MLNWILNKLAALRRRVVSILSGGGPGEENKPK
jgi:hypothetical protein